VVKIQVQVFFVLTLCSDMVGYQRFGGSSYLHLQGEVKMERVWSSETCPSSGWLIRDRRLRVFL